PAAGSAGIRAAPKTPASSPPSAGRSRNDARLPAGLPLQSEPQNEPERIDPRSSSPGPCRFTTEVTCPDFYSGATGRSGRFGEGFLLRRLQEDRALAKWTDLGRIPSSRRPSVSIASVSRETA